MKNFYTEDLFIGELLVISEYRALTSFRQWNIHGWEEKENKVGKLKLTCYSKQGKCRLGVMNYCLWDLRGALVQCRLALSAPVRRSAIGPWWPLSQFTDHPRADHVWIAQLGFWELMDLYVWWQHKCASRHQLWAKKPEAKVSWLLWTSLQKRQYHVLFMLGSANVMNPLVLIQPICTTIKRQLLLHYVNGHLDISG